MVSPHCNLLPSFLFLNTIPKPSALGLSPAWHVMELETSLVHSEHLLLYPVLTCFPQSTGLVDLTLTYSQIRPEIDCKHLTPYSIALDLPKMTFSNNHMFLCTMVR